jgi:prepilin-type N-terminal cleavage/methylation domain-containing protein
MSAASRRRAARPHEAGFTLLEMLAVIFLMSIVLFVAIDFYLDLSVASNTAAERTRGARRAVGLLDRVARDLEAALLLQKPDALDPIAWPWLFLAESESTESGADRVKFVRAGHHPNAASAAESDLELVSWVVTPGADGEGDLELRRASWPQLPESRDRTFPTAENSDVVAAGLASFGIRFQGEDGSWSGRWDSTTLAGSSQLPMVAEIEVSFRTGPGADDVEGPYLRRVVLPLRPIDLEEQLAQAAGVPGATNPRDQDGDGKDDVTGEPVPRDATNTSAENTGDEQEDAETGEMTVAQCLAVAPQLAPLLENLGDPGLVASIKSLRLSAVPPQFSSWIPAACRQ